MYLETLSADELRQLADKYSVDIPDGMERVFIIEALMESAFGNVDISQAVEIIESDFLEAAALPRQYNISFIDVMIRDPLWAFVFWEIKTHDREACENAPNFENFCLKVIPMDDPTIQDTGVDDSFVVPVDSHNSGLYLNFPPAEGSYRVEFCAVHKGNLSPLIVSHPFRLPKLLESPNQKPLLSPEFQILYDNPLACLSGVREFPVIRSTDRLIRVRENNKHTDSQ